MGRMITISRLNARQTPQYSYQISGTSRSEALFRQLQVAPSPPDLMWQVLPKDLFKISPVSTIATWSWKLVYGVPMDYIFKPVYFRACSTVNQSFTFRVKIQVEMVCVSLHDASQKTIVHVVAPLSILTLYDYIVILNREKPNDGFFCSIALAPQICAFAPEVHFEAPEVRKTTGSGAPRKKFCIIL